ncbi:MAG: hypothetical protein JXO48_04410, partial [Deltaproteobacteria bacterium]|nr:hypothetical protein [Deltaproteobacteria bacterium]
MKDGVRRRETVLFCGPMDEPLNSGRYMIDGMERLGYCVVGYDYRTHDRFETEIPELVERERPAFVLTLKGEKLSPGLIEGIRKTGATAILWFTMIPLEDWMVPLALAHDFVCTNVEDHLAYFRRAGVLNVKWVHQGFAPEFFGIAGPGGEYGGG